MADQVLESNVMEAIEFDAEGYMLDATAWTPDIARALAAQAGLTLTDRHFAVIEFARAEFFKNGDAPSIRRITKESGVDTKELYALFPGGPAKLAAKIAGLKKPTGCI